MARRVPSDPEESIQAGAALAGLDAVREEVVDLVTDASHWEAEARRQRSAAEGLAQVTRELTEEVHRVEADAARSLQAAGDRTEALAAEREDLAQRLRRAEFALDAARAEGEAQARRGADREERSTRLVEASCRLHALQMARLEQPDTLFDHILEASVELAGAEKGAYLRSAPPFDTLATQCFDEAQSGSPLLAAAAARVVELRAPVIANNPAEIGALAEDRLAASLQNLTAYPVVAREQLTGVVVIANKSAGPFTDDDTRLLLGIGGHAAVALENRRLRRAVESAYAGTVALLGDVIEAKDPATHGHCEQVAALALAAARELGLDPADQAAVAEAGLLHDVGKIAVSDGILLKTGALMAAERALIETHPVIGADLIRQVPGLRDLAPIVRHHHERYDGAGYPDRLAGEDIPLLARVLGVADAYEAMRSDRPYRPALPAEAAREELRRGAGGQFDPAVVDALARALETPGAVERARRDVLGGAMREATKETTVGGGAEATVGRGPAAPPGEGTLGDRPGPSS